MIKYNFCTAQIGQMLVAKSNKGLCAVLLGDDKYKLLQELQKRFPKVQLVKQEAPNNIQDMPLDIIGTDFQKKVWKEICKIKRGETATYSEIAKNLGMPKAYRAVANACAANNIAIVIPCHRVVRSDGKISGYAWGVELKNKLLNFESQT